MSEAVKIVEICTELSPQYDLIKLHDNPQTEQIYPSKTIHVHLSDMKGQKLISEVLMTKLAFTS